MSFYLTPSKPVLVSFLWLAICLALTPLYGQKNKPSANIEQLRNGSLGTPVDPGIWVKGNLGSSNSHYAEALSAPYRVVMKNVAPLSTVTLVFEYDVQHSVKLALDYLTSYDRLQPHSLNFGHDQEEVNPTIGTDLFQSPPEAPTDLFLIPAPEVLNSPVAGQPLGSYNNVAGAGQAEMAIWNGDITNIVYVGSTPDLSGSSNQSQQVAVTFTAGDDPSETVILSWGGHIASRSDWGFDTDGSPRSAGGISGSPYHTRLDSWSLGNLGNQDLSMSIDLVLVPNPPSAPANFKATAVSIGEILLEWEEVAAANSTYTIERSLTGTDSWEVVASNLPQNATSLNDTGLLEFTKYFYRISASNTDGTSDFSIAEVSTFSVISTVFNRNGKSGEKIGLDLETLNAGEAGEDPSGLNFQFDAKGDVLVEVVGFLNPNTIGAVVTLLQQKYGRVSTDFILDPQFYIDNDRNLIDVYFPVDRLDELNFEDDVNFVRPVYIPYVGNHALGETGVLSQGDSSQTSRDARASFQATRLNESGELEALPVDGSGIKIGVLSNSFNTQPFSGADSRYITDQKNLDLPGPFNPNRSIPVEVLEEAPFTDADEGRAMLQIVHDVSPGADLAFHHGTTSLNKFAEGINALSAAGAQVIVDDITFLPELFFKQSGPAFDAINNHVSTPGNMYFTSSGNFSDQAEQGIFNGIALPGTAEIYPPGVTGFINDFGGGSTKKPIFVNPGEYVLVLQWDEDAVSQGDPIGAANDLDVFIVSDDLRVMAGNNRINIDGDPTEILIFRSSAPRAANLVVTCECETPPSNLGFRMVAFKTDGEGDGLVFTEPWSNATVTGHAMSSNAVTVGASFYGYYGTAAGPELEPFSSLAGTLPNGQTISVDLTGPDGGNTNVISIGSDINFDEDIFPNFFGTSAAAPHVAAAVSLMLSALPTWYPDGVPTENFTDPPNSNDPSSQSLALFIQTASPVSNPGRGGAGLLRAEDAFKAIASQTPFLNGEFTIEDGKVISAEDVIVTLLGDYFSPDSKVFFDDEEVPTTVISETEIQAVIPPFSGQGKLVVANTASSTPGGGDGGDSNGIDLLDGRRAIALTADDQLLEFGQDFDNLSFTVSGLEEGETYQSLGLPDIVLNATATGPFPDVNNYTIFPELTEPLSTEQEDQFIVSFFPGTLSFDKKALTILASDTTAIYGDEPGIELNYLYDATAISDNDLFINTIQSEHEATYNQNVNGVGLVNRFVAVVNDNPERAEDLIDLIQNSNWMVTETSISNRFVAVVNDFNVLKFEADQLLDYLDNPLVGNSTSTENRFVAVVNGSDLVTGLTSVYDPIENRFVAVVNDFSAIVNRFVAVVNVPLGDENDNNDYSTTLAIIDVEDGAPEGSDPNDLPPTNVYSINLITGLDVTPESTTNDDQRHWIVPGAFLSPFGTNFDINFQAGRLSIDPKPVFVNLDEGGELPIEINYGETAPSFSSTAGPTAFGEELTVSYNLNPTPTDPVSAGTYEVIQDMIVADPEGVETTSNYAINAIDGTLVVHPGTLTITTDNVLIDQGDDIPAGSEINSNIEGFIPGETAIDVFPPNGPVFDYASPDYESAGRESGTYLLLTTLTQDPLNYNVVDNTAQLIVNLADGKKIRIFLDCVARNNGNNAEWPFTAYFRYENDNAVSIFIQPGTPDNEIIGTSYDDTSIPFEFLPGSHQVPVPFDGENLRWKVATFGSTNPSSQEVSSNDINGNRCKAKDIEVNARTAGTDSSEEGLGLDITDDVQFYPNPVNDRLVVQLKEGFSRDGIELYNSQGLRRNVNVAFTQSTAEFDFTGLDSGLYLLKLDIDGTTAIIRILRQ